ncbi:phenylacetate--CoA ligase family protein [Endozoicomonas ascidiicola]|uniref:phenylacetate--CoA ligase family protein n=1 Tax=Endozoicomonas ascidiicola TaxID=1698521 RepID=UPI00082F52E7|nr:AMP-binding protein [Endozoicomonas ascidiicola]
MSTENCFSIKEVMNPAERERYLFGELRETLSRARTDSVYYQQLLQNVNPASIQCREDLARLPVTRKSDLIRFQAGHPPFGGLNGVDPGAVARLFQSPGPIQEPEGKGDDWWRMGQAFYAAGFRAGDIVHNTLSYHLSPGGFIMDSGARACGCAVIPAGTGQTELQLQVIDSLKPTGYCGTPSFLKTLLEKADAKGQDLSFTHAMVSGEALPESLRSYFQCRGIQCFQCYATADLGLIAYESHSSAGMMVAEDIILEILNPDIGEVVPEGGIGEVVVTSFNPEYPMIRFATGDLSAVAEGSSACGRTNTRIRGWLGRSDISTKVRGLFVHPNQVTTIVQRHHGIIKAQFSISHEEGKDRLTLLYESSDQVDTEALKKSIKSVTRLRGETQRVETLAKEDQLIVDERG